MEIKFGRTLEDFKADIASGAEKVFDDEFLHEGLPYCKKCRTRRFFVTEDRQNCVRRLCECQRQAKAEEEKRQNEIISQFEAENRKVTLEAEYEKVGIPLRARRGFEKATLTTENKAIFDRVRNYANKAETVIENNLGLYLYGEQSTGKTFLLGCLCKALVDAEYTCHFSTFDKLMQGIKGNRDEATTIMKMVEDVDFLFLDDFGKEFLSRETNKESMKWVETQLFQIINLRDTVQKPLICSSNYAVDELESTLALDRGIVDRINSMIGVKIEMNTGNFRRHLAERKQKWAKENGF